MIDNCRRKLVLTRSVVVSRIFVKILNLTFFWRFKKLSKVKNRSGIQSFANVDLCNILNIVGSSSL